MTYIEHLNDKFRFGKFCGCTFAEVAQYSPDYINWVVENVSGTMCVFDDSVIDELRIMFPDFDITSDFEDWRNQRMDEYEEMHAHDVKIYEEDNMNQGDCYEPRTYGRYSGSYAQDEMGYSDDDIDTIFDGDPSAYWNID